MWQSMRGASRLPHEPRASGVSLTSRASSARRSRSFHKVLAMREVYLAIVSLQSAAVNHSRESESPVPVSASPVDDAQRDCRL